MTCISLQSEHSKMRSNEIVLRHMQLSSAIPAQAFIDIFGKNDTLGIG